MIEVDSTDVLPPSDAPVFAPLPASAAKTSLKSEMRRITIPPHRMTPLKKEWVNIFGPLTEILGLQVRMNVQRRCVETRVRRHVLSSHLAFILSRHPSTQKTLVRFKKAQISLKLFRLGSIQRSANLLHCQP